MQFFPVNEVPEIVKGYEKISQAFGNNFANFHDFDLTAMEFDGQTLKLTFDLQEHEFAYRIQFALKNAQIKSLHLLPNLNGTTTVDDILIAADQSNNLVFAVDSISYINKGTKSSLEVLCTEVEVVYAERIALWIRNPKY